MSTIEFFASCELQTCCINLEALRKNFIKIAAGDTVKMEMSPYDLEKARITFRMKEQNSNYTPPPRRRNY